MLDKHIIEKPVSPQQVNPEVTTEFANLVLKMLAKKKEDRPKDFYDVLTGLKSLKVYKNVENKSFST